MNQQEKFNRFVARHPHDHTHFWKRPVGRRQFFQLLGAGVSGYFLSGARAWAQQTAPWPAANVETQNRARNVVFLLMQGAPSHTDLFDLKVIPGVTPNTFRPETVNEILFPIGLLPKTAGQLGSIAIVRSLRSWSAVHGLAQTWTQIGRSPVSVSGKIAPHMGSVVAIEKERERTPSQKFPGFLAMNVGNSPGASFLPAQFAPFKFAPSAGGLANTIHPGGAGRFNDRWNLLHVLDGTLRQDSPLGKPGEDVEEFYESARDLMNNPVSIQAFRYTAADSARYGNSPFGNALLVTKQVLAANQGTRFVQINLGGWDMHSDIYTRLGPLAKTFDDGFGPFLADMEAAGLLGETLVVVMGEFGRTVGPLTGQRGRDHFLQQFVLFAGGGVRGGRAIGATNASGAFTAEPGWGRERDVRVEDVEATVYSALGINWTTVRYDDPFKRGFEYVPFAREDAYGPVNELWG